MRKLACSIFLATLLMVLSVNKTNALNYYWIGGTGNWDDLNHWATTSGGTVLHNYIPTAVDDVFFDAHSFNAAGQTVTLNPQTILCHDMDWTGVTNMPSLEGATNSLLKIYGSLKFIPAMVVTEFYCAISFEATAGSKTITLAGQSINNNVAFNGIGGGWTLQDTFNVGWISFNAGTLTTNNQTINVGMFESRGTFSRTLNMGSSTFNVRQDWYIEPTTAMTLNCGTSVINCTLNSFTPIFAGNNLTYYDLNFTGPDIYILLQNNNRFHNAVFYGKAVIDGSNTFYSATFKKDAEVRSNNNYTNITFTPGYSYSFYAGTTQSVSGIVNAVGNCGAYVDINSYTQGSQFTISHPAGTVNISFAILKDVLATGGANFTASNSISISNNTGWSFTSPVAHDLYWIGNNGNWNDGNHWSFTSGGAPSGCSPTPLDNVFFDVNSFSSPGQAVAINIPTAYCRDIFWTGVTNNPTFTADFNTKLKIYGSLRFSPAMAIATFYCVISFEATTGGKTITMAGQSITNNVVFNGIGGGWTLQDTFNVGWISFSAGTLTTNNQTVNIGFFESRGTFSRTLNMGSSVFNVTSDWYIEPTTAIALNCGTSTINCTLNSYTPIFNGANLTYYDLNFTGPDIYILLQNNNRFHNAVFYGKAVIDGSNTFYSATFKKDAEVRSNNNYTNITFTPGYSYSFYAGTTQSVSGIVNAVGNCGAYVDINSYTQGSQFTISHPAGTVNISFAILKDVLATGGANFTASNSISISNNTGWSFTSPVAHDLYWIGNNGNWNDGNHWSFTSGGAPSGCSPTPLDNVFFDVNSFSSPGQAVAINIPTAYCRDIFWTGVTNNPTFTADFNTKLKIYGSLRFSPAMTIATFYCVISFEATTGGKTITMAGQSITNNVVFNGIGGGWTLQDTFNVGWISFSAGTLTTNNQTVNIGFFESRGTFSRTLNMGSSVFNVTSDWYIEQTTAMILNCGTSTINCTLNSYNPIFAGNGLTFYDVNFTGPDVYAIFKDDNRFHDVVFYGNALMQGANTFHKAAFKRDAEIWENNNYGDLIFTAGYTYMLYSGKTQTVNNNWWIQGSCVSYIVLKSSVNGMAATVTKSSGSVAGYNIHIKDIHCTGGAVFNAYNSVDLGGNSGWIFSQLPPLQNPGSIAGTNPVCLGATNVVYHISPVPGSIYYEWTVPAGATIISGQGDTAITVNFGTATSGIVSVQSFNGCNYGTITSSDITIIASAPLPAVTISANPGNTICPGNAITFVAVAQDTAGIAPRYDFMVNSNIVQSSSANGFTNSSFVNGDMVSCMIYLPASACFAATTATSNSIAIVVGSISPPSSLEAMICNDQLPYIWNGQSYNSAGDYTQHFANSTGCDSMVTLHLSIANNSQPSSIGAVMCNDQLPYLWNGQVYDSAGDYTQHFANSTGCDSMVTLHLAITNSSLPSKIEAALCNDQLPYLWNGQAYNSAGDYTLHLTNSTGCDSSITLHLTVEPPGSVNCSCELIIPNAFTPNGDGINDYWKISHTDCILKTDVSIYNRYGSLIYHADNYQNNWNGTFRSGTCPDGTYYYVIKAIYLSKAERLIRGNITILR
ncbi:MAG: gliding motility-associated C-terminal domain-containing protein [Ferruginibacter sp.]